MLNLLLVIGSMASLALPAQAAPRFQEAIIEEVKVTQENAGINPNSFSYLVEATVLVGSNSCTAKGVKIHLSKRHQADSINLVGVKRMPFGPSPICIQIWAPVYKKISTRITGTRSRTSKVFIHNVGEMGAVKNLDQFLQPTQTTTVKGILQRVMSAGGESTGIALETSNGDFVELDLSKNDLQRRLEQFEDRMVVVTGTMTRKAGIEIQERIILIADDIYTIEN